jgi:hypothetical protein
MAINPRRRLVRRAPRFSRVLEGEKCQAHGGGAGDIMTTRETGDGPTRRTFLSLSGLIGLIGAAGGLLLGGKARAASGLPYRQFKVRKPRWAKGRPETMHFPRPIPWGAGPGTVVEFKRGDIVNGIAEVVSVEQAGPLKTILRLRNLAKGLGES